VVLDKRRQPRHSVRCIVVHRKHLYVTDEAGDVVKVFNVQSGELMAHITGRALQARVVIDGKLDAPSGLRRRLRRRFLRCRAKEAAGASLFLQREEKGDVH
jgi:hypothetical protein